ncbi:DUF6434 domain-containing protein [Neptunomonas qingdaonensis]|uniref:DUF6434 domain-containing protein n=1 Tax=Neptunomonas qingdaonensis TaxID=1045558 RepID=UPI000A4F2919|nr:DUF6434 domain-containing protein [Neptunomonas qingdaonensis]
MNNFDWHSDTITAETPVTNTYKNTQNVRRFLKEICGSGFTFNREFMAWIKDGNPKLWGMWHQNGSGESKSNG